MSDVNKYLPVPLANDPEGDEEEEEKEEDNTPAPLPKRRRVGQRVTEEERAQIKETFLRVLANTANKRAAYLQAGVDRGTINYWCKKDPEFEQRIKEADEEANWVLFGEAWRRAMMGEEEYVISMGKMVYGPEGKPLTIRKRSDKLLELLLRARLPEFREKGVTVVNILPKEYIDLPPDGTVE